jgi:hypothetical protein
MSKKPAQKLDVETAHAIAADLPDGAYWAMMEELTGLDPASIITRSDYNFHGAYDERHANRTAETHPLLCKRCQRRFADQKALQMHIRTKHGKGWP